ESAVVWVTVPLQPGLHHLGEDVQLLVLRNASEEHDHLRDGFQRLALHHFRARAFFPAAVFIFTLVGSPVRFTEAKSSSCFSVIPVSVALPARFLANSAPMNFCWTWDLAGIPHLQAPSISAKT